MKFLHTLSCIQCFELEWGGGGGGGGGGGRGEGKVVVASSGLLSCPIMSGRLFEVALS